MQQEKSQITPSWMKLHCGDSRQLTKEIPSNSVDLILTSPPYAGLKDYGHFNQIGFGQDYNTYLNDMAKVLEACYKVAKDTASLWVIIDSYKQNGTVKLVPFHIVEKAEEKGWILQDIIIWNKTKTLPWSHQGRTRKVFEYILFFTKTQKYKYFPERIRETCDMKEWWKRYPERYNPKGKVPHNIWHFAIPTQGSWGNGLVRHFNPFPPQLVERIISLTTDPGDVVLDPFAGTGTVLAQAQCMDRYYVGMEINPKFVDILFPDTQKEVSRQWSQRKSTIIEAEQNQIKFEILISQLRKIKYAKQALKAILESQETAIGDTNSKIESVLLLERDLTDSDKKIRQNLWAIDILMVVSDQADVSEIQQSVEKATRRAPLSKYGIAARIEIIDTSSVAASKIIQKIGDEEKLHVYRMVPDHYSNACISKKDWLRYIKERVSLPYCVKSVPPVLSTIQVTKSDLDNFPF